MNPYDPAKSFCTEGDVYDLCGGKAYDPKKSFCSEGELFSCDGKPYDPEKQYCKLATTVENYGWLEDARDKQNIQVYKTVKICNDETSCQTWMAENLNYDSGEQSWCGGGRGETEGDCSVYGRLYTWNAAKNACPEGWHLPSEIEWTSLLTYSSTEVTYDVSISKNTYVGAGMALKSNSGWNEDGNGDDAYGFSVLPAGYRGPLVLFAGVRDNATFWTVDQTFSTYDAYYVLFKKDADDVSTSTISSESKNYGYSVRCIQDN
ncbi:MAG: hypothetical protein MJY82_07485 [Fibrobacter sp.]|nr:hypothetical protein [Fibrobacter sp.]